MDLASASVAAPAPSRAAQYFRMWTEHQQYSPEAKFVYGQGPSCWRFTQRRETSPQNGKDAFNWWASEPGALGVRWTIHCLCGAKDCRVGRLPLTAISKADSGHVENHTAGLPIKRDSLRRNSCRRAGFHSGRKIHPWPHMEGVLSANDSEPAYAIARDLLIAAKR